MDSIPATSQIKSYLEGQLLVTFGQDVGEEENLFQKGIMDSYGFIELITYLESQYAIKFSDEDLLSGSLTSLSRILETVNKKINV